MKYLLTLLYISISFGSSIEQLKWHLNPNNQVVKIEKDDLHDELLKASPHLDFGYSRLGDYKLNKKVKVAIIDSGLDYKHEAFERFLSLKLSECSDNKTIVTTEVDADQNGKNGDCLGWDFAEQVNQIEDTDGHGTHVAGLISDFFKLSKDKLEILPLKVFTDSKKDRPLPIKIGKALEYALEENVDLVHLSLGWPESLMSVKLHNLIKKVMDKGILIVAASGNSAQTANIYPCKIKGVVCVGALRANGDLAPFSNHGPQVDFLAPGEKILSTIPKMINPVGLPIEGYDYKSGTSQAAPLVSGALLFLKSLYPNETSQDLVIRMMQSAPSSKYSMRGMFNLIKAIEVKTMSQYPILKDIKPIVIGEDHKSTISIRHNYKKSSKISYKLSCSDQIVSQGFLKLTPGVDSQIKAIFTTKEKTDFVNCAIKLGSERSFFQLKVLNNFPTVPLVFPFLEKGMIKPTRKGVRSKLLTIPNAKDSHREPLYYVAREKNLKLFVLNNFMGEFEVAANCKKLRTTQIDINKDGNNDIFFEILCDEKYLEYHFLDQTLVPIYPKIKFEPKLSIINYKKFDLFLKNGMPHIRYIGKGFSEEDNDAWEEQSGGRSTHIYELVPRLELGEWAYSEHIHDDPKRWSEQLGFRYEKSFQILKLFRNKALIKHGLKSYWYDLESKELKPSGLDHLLISNDDFQSLSKGNDNFSVNSLITPYEVRAYISNGLSLRVKQNDLYDPFMSIQKVVEHELGYEIYVKSYYHLTRYRFDHFGSFKGSDQYTIEKFDFLSGEELDALLIPIESHDGLKFVLDGTKIHTSYIDVVGKELTSFKLLERCSTQLPVKYENESYLVFSCFEQGKSLLKLVSI